MAHQALESQQLLRGYVSQNEVAQFGGSVDELSRPRLHHHRQRVDEPRLARWENRRLGGRLFQAM